VYKIYVNDSGDLLEFLHVLDSSPLLLDSLSELKFSLLFGYSLDSPFFASLLWKEHIQYLSNTALLFLQLKHRFHPGYIFFE